MRRASASTGTARDVPGSEDDAGRERVSRQPMSPLLNHLLDCNESSRRERSGDAGGEPVPTADSILREATIRARTSGEVETAEDWFKDAGILSRWDETNIQMHEVQPDSELAYWDGRARRHLVNRLLRAEMIEPTEE